MRRFGDPRRRLSGSLMKAGFKSFLREYGAKIPDSFTTRVMQLRHAAASITAWIDMSPRTVVHGNVRSGHIALLDDDVAFLDWQSSCLGKGVLYFMHSFRSFP